jgi:hypothetical protein
MAVSNSQTAIAGSLSGYITGSRLSFRFLQSSVPRRSSAGTDLAFAAICAASRAPGGRPQIEAGLRALIRQMSMENPLWGAPRIHGELLKLGFEVAQSSVAKYQATRAAKPGMAHLPAQSRPRYRRYGLVRCSHYRFRPALCIRRRPIRPQRSGLDQRHKESDGRMGCTPDNGGISLGRGSRLHDPRPGSHLWHHRHTSIARHGDSRRGSCMLK